MKKRIAFGVFAAILLGPTLFLAIQTPSHNRDWKDEGELLSQGIWNQNHTIVTLKDMRNWSFHVSEPTIKEWQTTDFSPADIEAAWFITAPFSKFAGVAHTMLMFDFENGESVLVSVEARKEEGETYSPWKGLWNQYELAFLWGTPHDFLVRRAVVDQDPVRMMKLKSSPEFMQNLFRDFIKKTNEIYAKPVFYNTLFSNCTIELARAANRQESNTIPFSISQFLPGYADKTLFDLGFIDTTLAWEEAQTKSYVHEFIKEHYQAEGWEELLKDTLRVNRLSIDAAEKNAQQD